MDGQRLLQQAVDGLARMQRAIRILEDHLHLAVEGLVAARPKRLAVDGDLPPEATGARPAMARSIVDFPEPDSPTRPKDSARR